MGLNTEERQQVNFFTGYEVEHTIAFNKYTLFVVGIQPIEEILKIANEQKVEHIYFGTSQSFKPTQDNFKKWSDMIVTCLKQNYWVTLDFDVTYSKDVLEESYCEYNRFIPMISVKLPYIEQFNYNTTLKLDDTTWGATNPGVWTHHLPSLMDKTHFTYWDQYTQDKDLK